MSMEEKPSYVWYCFPNLDVIFMTDLIDLLIEAYGTREMKFFFAFSLKR